MYSGPFRRVPFQPDPSNLQYSAMREEYAKNLWQKRNERETGAPPKEAASLSQLLDLVSPEDSALIAMIIFLLCDNTNNDVVMLGILLYVLLSK
ncbi:MAG: hypothetical protein IKD31_03675 [Clostridia bacterium]|nr:hypothetical protein [Clostridia bacterium]